MFRRRFLQSIVSSVVLALAGGFTRLANAASPYSFMHGIASGDPLADGIILWTRVSGARNERLRVQWKIASDVGMQTVLRSGDIRTDAGRDYTVKVDVRKLPSGAELFYQFRIDGIASPIGRTRTLPTGSVDLARLAVVSCSNYPAGYFHAYREIAKRDDIDAVIHLGDYIYEYGLGEYATENAESLNRVPDPVGELLTRVDYRRRYAQYRSDPDAQAMHGRHAFIAVWDDHEIANDAWRGGAENHDAGEGTWSSRRDAAITTYFEWMPIRGIAAGARTRIFRDFRYGDLMSLIMLDTRLYGRDQQPDVGEDVTRDSVVAALADPKRRMLGYKQEKWLRKALKRASTASWQVIGQQVLVSPVNSPDLEPLLNPDGPSSISRELLDHNILMSKGNPPLLLDTWDGYPQAKQDFLHDLQALARNPVILSGDLHTSIAGNLVPDGQDLPVAVEFMTTSVTSPGFAEYLPEKEPGMLRDATIAQNPNLKYMETDRRGWLCMTVSKTECIGEWHLLDGVRSRTYASTVDRRLSVRAGEIAAGLRPA